MDFLFSEYEPINPYVDNAISTTIYLMINVAALFIVGVLIETIRKYIETAYHQ